MISFYTQPDSFSILFDTITLNEKEYFKKDEKNNNFINFGISLDKEGIEFGNKLHEERVLWMKKHIED